MLLSFERPPPAACGLLAQQREDGAVRGRRVSLSTVLENCTEATSAAGDKRRLNNGYHRARQRRQPYMAGGVLRWA